MVKDEYERLMEMLGKSTKLEVSLEEILKESVLFFELMRKEFPQASEVEREEMIHMMTSLHAKLREVSKVSAEASGMSEEELNAFAEDPSNFTPEQWQMVQETRKKLYDSARKFSSTMEEKMRKGEVAQNKEQSSKGKKVAPKMRRGKRKDWLKS